MITLNHYQLCTLKEISEYHECNPKHFKTLVVYEAGENAHHGSGIYAREQHEMDSEGTYLATDEADQARANAVSEERMERDWQDYQAILDQIDDDDRTRCLKQATCCRAHAPDWLFRVPATVKEEKTQGRCLCAEYKGAVIEVELAQPLNTIE
ncbi:hypothetical protein [Stutzerimonas frequens]|uniref:hypothetical protein n=1 Tax=Stutzerimonas frequens TaxID=2968969 RepID=UPI0018A71A11|nr:hypothetical protein [Stutzerimonas frequens]MBF8164322.1 hypothetical protein [Pseudomonas mendocina]QTF59153.1 hypothetical protein J4H94_20905 [Stutzerimonas frequens]